MVDESRRARLAGVLGRALIHLILLGGVLVAAFPFLWMVLTSFKSYEEWIMATFLPSTLRLSNYMEAWNYAPFPRYLANSIFLSFSQVVLVLLTSVLAAYAFARIDFFGKNAIFLGFLATMMIPFEVTLIPNFITIRRVPFHPELPLFGYNLLGTEQSGWYNSYAAMVVPFAASVFSIFLIRQHFAAIPQDLYDAALLDGCGHFRFLISVVLPLSKPVLLTVSLLNFLWSWNAFLWPLIVTGKEELRPIQVGISSFVTESGAEVQLLMAGTTMALVPIIVLYLLAQRQFIEGIGRTGLKG